MKFYRQNTRYWQLKVISTIIGVPLTLLQLKEDHEIGIIEMGANHHGEIDALAEITKPNWGYITNFGKAHLEGFKALKGLFRPSPSCINI